MGSKINFHFGYAALAAMMLGYDADTITDAAMTTSEQKQQANANGEYFDTAKSFKDNLITD